MNLILLFLSIVLVNNVITSQFMGICPFLGVSKKVDTAIGMGAAVTFVLTLASFITYFVQKLKTVSLDRSDIYPLRLTSLLRTKRQYTTVRIRNN